MQEGRQPRAVPLETSKRKFNHVLEKLTHGNGSRVNHGAKGNGGDPNRSCGDGPNKRQRVAPRTTARDRLTLSIGTPRDTSSLPCAQQPDEGGLPGPRPSRASTEISRRVPNYSPWSQEQFLARLKTFADVKLWTPKPDEINEVEWAKRGWICEGINTVACKGGCEKRVVVILRSRRKDAKNEDIEDSEDYSIDVECHLVKKYKDFTLAGHDEHCLWRAGGCKPDIFRISLANPNKAIQELKQRYISFVPLKETLPNQDRLMLDADLENMVTCVSAEDTLTEPKLQQPLVVSEGKEPSTGAEFLKSENVPQYAFTFFPDQDGTTINITAFSFAIYGWSGSKDEAQNPIASCTYCFRRIGLWLYNNIEGVIDGDASNILNLNLVEEHRDYCPWKNPASEMVQGAYQGLAAWEILCKVIIGAGKRQNVQQDRVCLRNAGPTEAKSADTDKPIVGDHEERKLRDKWRRFKESFAVKRTGNT